MTRWSTIHESGMIGQVLYLEAEAHGLRGTGIGCFFDDAVHDLLGFENNAFAIYTIVYNIRYFHQ
jgi:hypothetical protein